MRRLVAAAAVGVMAVLAFAGTAQAATATYVAHIKSTPDDGTPPWARDTMTRTTTITPTADGFEVSIADNGTFATPAGVTGTITGSAKWTVTGGTLKSDLKADETIDRSSADSKGTFTSEWAARFFDGAQVGPIHDWTWTYDTGCGEKRVEADGKDVVGDYPSKKCPQSPSPSVKPSPTPSKTTKAPAGAPATTSAAGPTLPVTGSSAPVMTFVAVGAGGLLLGGGLWFAARRRRTRFTA